MRAHCQCRFGGLPDLVGKVRPLHGRKNCAGMFRDGSPLKWDKSGWLGSRSFWVERQDPKSDQRIAVNTNRRFGLSCEIRGHTQDQNEHAVFLCGTSE
jgi:hypothetical protein